ncbi:MAG TPA: tetratricopeptide repeat protein, partial [Anaerolineales bacterium]
LRDVAYQTLFKSERQGYHAKVADWLIGATQNSGRVGEFAPIIAEHYELSGKFTLAAEWYTNAGARAKNQGAPAQALTFYDRALALLTSGATPPAQDENFERRWQALIGRDEVLGILGETEKRMADDATLVDMAESVADDFHLAEAYYRQGYYLGVSGQYQKEYEAYVSGLAAAVRAHDRKREAMILGLKVFCEVRLGDLATVAQTAVEALQCAEELGDDEVLARILTNVSSFYTETGDIGQTTQLLERGLSIIRRIGNIEGEVIGLSNLGYAYILLGMTDEAIPALQRCIKLAQAIDHRSFRVYGSLNLGLAHLRGDDPTLAVTELEQCLVEFEAMNDVVDHSTCQTYTAMAKERIGRISEALVGFERAARKLVEIGTIGYAYDAKAGIARCLLARNDLEAAKQLAAQLWDYLQQGKVGMEFPLLGYETCADIFEVTGEAPMARRIIEAGFQELMIRANRISLPKLRQSYLERVPEHQRIRARWQEYSKTSQV